MFSPVKNCWLNGISLLWLHLARGYSTDTVNGNA